MAKNLDNEGLKSIVNSYDLFFIDLWGVVHNGIDLYEKAIEALIEIEKNKKNYVLLTNAPRPNKTVKIFSCKVVLLAIEPHPVIIYPFASRFVAVD